MNINNIENAVKQAVANENLTDFQSIENDWVVVNQLIPNYNSGANLAQDWFDKNNKSDEKA